MLLLPLQQIALATGSGSGSFLPAPPFSPSLFFVLTLGFMGNMAFHAYDGKNKICTLLRNSDFQGNLCANLVQAAQQL